MNPTVPTTHLKVMQEIERIEQRYKLAFFSAVLLEAALLAGLLLLTNLKDRTQVLMLVGFIGSYTIIVLALLALGAHVSRVGQRILRAVGEGSVVRIP